MGGQGYFCNSSFHTRHQAFQDERGFSGTGNTGSSTLIADENNDGQIEIGTVEDVEVNEASEHMDAAEAAASGNWEALFVPVKISVLAISIKKKNLTPTAEELEAMKT